MKNRVISLLCILVLLSILAIPASAAVDVVDLDRKGTMTIHMTYKGEGVSGGELTIYRVAEVYIDDGNHGFRYLPAFAGCKVPVEHLNSPILANSLLEIVQKKDIKGTVKGMDDKGRVTFRDLEVGLYLVVQNQAAPGYAEVEPFVVSLPQMVDDKYVYDINATPKMGMEPKPTTRPDGKLPQTGQIN